MFRLSNELGDWLGAGVVSLLADPLLDSHEKLMPSFLGAGAGDGVLAAAFEVGGGPHGIEGKFPESPCPLNGSLRGDLVRLGIVSLITDSFTELSSVASPPNFTSSRDDADMRCAVSKGDLTGVDSSA